MKKLRLVKTPYIISKNIEKKLGKYMYHISSTFCMLRYFRCKKKTTKCDRKMSNGCEKIFHRKKFS
jgi:hypothetical protein